MRDKLPPLNIDEFQLDTIAMSPVEFMAYMRLICTYWKHGRLPVTEDAIHAIAGIDDESWPMVRKKVAGMFEIVAGRWTHPEMDYLLAKSSDIADKRRAAGRVSQSVMRARRAKAQQMQEAIAANAIHLNNKSSANADDYKSLNGKEILNGSANAEQMSNKSLQQMLNNTTANADDAKSLKSGKSGSDSDSDSRAYNILNNNNTQVNTDSGITHNSNSLINDQESDVSSLKSNNTPAPARETDDDYAFEDGIIKLKAKDLENWKKAFPNVNIESFLYGRGEWINLQCKDGKKNWFQMCKGMLSKEQRTIEEQARLTAITAKAQAEATGQKRKIPLV